MTPKYNMETTDARAPEQLTYYDSPPPMEPQSSHHPAVRGFAQSVGLHPGMATAVIGTDLMVNAVEAMTLGLLMVLSLLAAIPLGIIVYKGQRKFYGDDHEAALIKALIVGLLTAIPGPLPYLLFVPAGIVGFFRRKP